VIIGLAPGQMKILGFVISKAKILIIKVSLATFSGFLTWLNAMAKSLITFRYCSIVVGQQ
jgi:hypothetical protein